MAGVARTFILREEVNAQALWAFLKNNWREMADAGKPLAVRAYEHRAKRSLPKVRVDRRVSRLTEET